MTHAASAALPPVRPSKLAVGLLLLLALVARLPFAMLNLALLLLMRDEGRSYAVAGVVAGASTVALGLAAPRVGRWADQHGATRVLMATAVMGMTATVLLGSFPDQLGIVGIAALALVGGASSPPIATVFRAALPRLVAPGEMGQMYALEAACQEAVYVVGPVLIITITQALNAQAGVIACGLLTGVLGVVFSLAMRRHAAPLTDHVREGSVLRNRRLRRLLVSYTLMGGTFGVIEVAAVASLDHMGNRGASGVVLGAWALGSLAGGLVVPRLWRAPTTVRLPILFAVLAALGLPLVALGTTTPFVLGTLVFAHGIAIAPTIGTVYEMIGQIVPEGALTEAFSWSIGTVVVGSAAGMALAGIATSKISVQLALALAIAFPALAAWAFGRPSRVAVPAARR